jgi:hypothetical protein
MKKLKLDTYEQQIENDIETGELQPVKNQKEEVKKYRGYFQVSFTSTH